LDEEEPAVDVNSLDAGDAWNVEEATVGRSGGSVAAVPPLPPPLAPLI
jgi:hypothetical protein